MSSDRIYRIAVAEDNAADLYLIEEALAAQGFQFELQSFDNGEDILRLIGSLDANPSNCPDLFLIDLNLPKISGDEVLARVRNSICARTPVIVITSSDAPHDKARAQEFGAVYFRKPADLEQFLAVGAVVRDLLEKSQSHVG